MRTDEKIQALKPLKSEFNKLSKQFDRILRYPKSHREVINTNRSEKLWKLTVEMVVVFREMQMIVNTPPLHGYDF